MGTPWETAVATAETAALLYSLFLKESGKPVPQRLNKRHEEISSGGKRINKKARTLLEIRRKNELWKLHKTVISCSGGKLIRNKGDMDATAFQDFRDDFLDRHG